MRNPDRLDALCWSLLSALVLLLLPVGHVSPDGLGQGLAFAAGFSRWNPNHLLVEPLGTWWMDLANPGSRAEAVDHLRRLSILAGSLAAGLFRLGVARRLAAGRRLAANHATLWLVFSSAFLRLWILDEIYMVQMPAVVGVAWLTLRYLERPSSSRALAAGASVSLAAAFFIENLLLGPALAVALGKRPKHAAGVLLGTLATLPVFAAAWASSPVPHGFLDWMTRYGGGVPARVESAYGITGLFESVSRALYGSACALVDLAPLVAALRDQMDVSVLPRAAAFAAGAGALLFARGRAALLLSAVWAAAVLAFGIYWNNSDDQFYVQLAVPFAALAAGLRGRAAALGLVALLWNAVDVADRRVLYPRQERLAVIERELGEAGLIVYPGFDEMEVLLALEPVAPAISVTHLSVRLPPEEGLRDLAARIRHELRRGGAVAVVDILDVPPARPPWKFLRRMGYDHGRVAQALQAFPVERKPERAGPFSVRWIPDPMLRLGISGSGCSLLPGERRPSAPGSPRRRAPRC